MSRIWNYRQSFSFLVALFLVVMLCESWRAHEAEAAPQGKLETPEQGSAQSGIGLIRGWVCSASRVDIEVVGRGSLTAVYGEAREDTRAACGDSNNGFSLQFNWNLLGEGVHTVRAVADGEEFARAAVTVGTLGRLSFLGAPQRDFPIANFPADGQTTLLRWLENRQQFVLSDGGTPPAEGSNPRADAKLEDPQPGSFQSGIGFIRGWVCSASRVEVEVIGRATSPAVYGEPRGDTKAACGDDNNGFSVQVNWNDLGDGDYTVRALADGVEVGRAAFRVVTLRLGSFPTGLEREAVLADFPQAGRQTTVEWQKSQQNFVVLAASPPGISGGLSGRQHGTIQDVDGTPGRAEIINRASSSGNLWRAIMRAFDRAFGTEAAEDREQRAASAENFFLCGTSLSIEQGGQTFGAGSFRIVDVAGNDVCQELPPGTTFPILLQVEATSSLNFNAPFTVIYNSQPVTAFQSSEPPSAVLTVSRTSVVFDAIPVGSAQDETFTITNTGSAALTGGLTLIASGSGAGTFTLLSGDTVQVAPGQSQEVTVRYTALSEEALLGSVRLSTNGGVATVILQGRGEQPLQLSVTPTSVNFGSVPAQGTATATFTVANSGAGVLTGSVSTGAPFSIVSGGSFSLKVGQRQTVTVRVTGGTAGPMSAPATVTSNGGVASVTLSATFATIGGSTPAPPQLCTTPETLDFGAVTVNTTREQTFTVENCTSVGTLTGSVSTSAPFSIVSEGSFSLGARQNQTVTVRFTPTASGPVTGSVTVSSNSGSAIVTLRGSGQPPVPDPQLSGVPSSLDFGSVTVGQSGELTFTVTNGGGGTLTGSVSTVAPFSIVSGGSFNLEAGQSQTVTMHFSPTGAGAVTGSAIVSSNGGSATVTLSGSGQTPVPDPQLSGVPSSLDFGSVTVGQSGELTFTVTNGGGGTLIGSVTTSDPFSVVVGGSFSLGAGQSQTVTVRYSPTTAGPASGSVTVSSDGGSATVTLSGSGQPLVPGPQLSVFPTIFDFGSVPINSQSATQSFTITNSGGGTLTGTIEYTLSPPTRFSLQQGQSDTFSIYAVPGGPPGPFDFPILITSNGGDITLHLTGTAVEVLPPQLSVSPLILDFGTFSAASGSPTLFITIQNVGGGTLTGAITGFSGGGSIDFSLLADESESFPISYPPGFLQFPANINGASLTVDADGDAGSVTITITGTVVP